MILIHNNFLKLYRALGTSSLPATVNGHELTMGEVAIINKSYPVHIEGERLTKLYCNLIGHASSEKYDNPYVED